MIHFLTRPSGRDSIAPLVRWHLQIMTLCRPIPSGNYSAAFFNSSLRLPIAPSHPCRGWRWGAERGCLQTRKKVLARGLHAEWFLCVCVCVCVRPGGLSDPGHALPPSRDASVDPLRCRTPFCTPDRVLFEDLRQAVQTQMNINCFPLH